MSNKKKSPWTLLKDDLKHYWMTIGLMILLWAGFSIFLGTPCISVLLTGFPCPFCGTTRALWYALQFDFTNAFAYQPLWPTLPLTLITFILYRYVQVIKGHWFILLCVFEFCLFILLYVLRILSGFPGEGPMTYTNPNLWSILWSILH